MAELVVMTTERIEKVVARRRRRSWTVSGPT